MKKLFLSLSVGLFTLGSFATNSSEKIDNSEKDETVYLEYIKVYCDGEYAGDIAKAPGFTTADYLEMANSMCE